MYDKNLTEFLGLRLSAKDMDFLRDLSHKRSIPLSECIRSILSEYRRNFDSFNCFYSIEKEACNSDGNFKTYINNKL